MAGNQQLTPRMNLLEPNVLVDGAMEIWPEGLSRNVGNNTQAYGAVLMQTINTATGITITNSQNASVPSGTALAFSNQLAKTASGSVVAGTGSFLRYIIEGYDLKKLWVDEFSVIFWVKSSVVSNRSLGVQNGTSTHSYVQQYNISAANTWQLKVLKIPGLSSCPGTLNRTFGAGLSLYWPVVTGATTQTASLNQWVAANVTAGVGEDTTWLTGTNHDFSLAGVMILPGDWTSLMTNTSQYRYIGAGHDFQDEHAKTLRMFEKSYSLTITPGTITDIGAHREQSGANGVWRKAIPTKVPMRVAPQVVFYNNATGAANSVRVGVGNFTPGAAGFGENTIAFEVGGVAANSDAFVHWTFDARF